MKMKPTPIDNPVIVQDVLDSEMDEWLAGVKFRRDMNSIMGEVYREISGNSDSEYHWQVHNWPR